MNDDDNRFHIETGLAYQETMTSTNDQVCFFTRYAISVFTKRETMGSRQLDATREGIDSALRDALRVYEIGCHED